MSKAAAVFIDSIPCSISVFSWKYIFPKMPDRAAHKMTRIHSHAKSIAIVRYCENILIMPKMRAVTAAMEPTTTANTCSIVSTAVLVPTESWKNTHPFRVTILADFSCCIEVRPIVSDHHTGHNDLEESICQVHNVAPLEATSAAVQTIYVQASSHFHGCQIICYFLAFAGIYLIVACCSLCFGSGLRFLWRRKISLQPANMYTPQ